MKYIWVYFLILFLYIFDLGNLDAVRQSTEGFYLQIVKEMHNLESFMTPKYLGENHWSKPPGHFWLALILSKPFGEMNIFFPRFAMVLTSLFGIFFISRWLKRYFSIDTLYSFVLMAGSIGIYRYARIYMMEAPLAFFSILGALKLYDYYENGERKDLVWCSFLLAFSILIKGPVSVVMVGLGLLPYLMRYREFHWKKSFSVLFLTLFLASLWFIASYINYGQEFYQTFFLDQNLGKFTAKNYPSRVLFQGLLIFCLPWIFYFPFYGNKEYFLKFSTNKPTFFLLMQFLSFFFIWLIPNQKSHHYAYPSSVLFIMLLAILILKDDRIKKIPDQIISVLSVVLISIIFTGSFWFHEFSFGPLEYTSLVFILLVTIILFVSKNLLARLLSPFLILGLIYNFLLPSFYLPYIPQKVVDLVGESKIGVVARKPFFIKEQVNSKEMEVLNSGNIRQYILEHNHLYFVHEEVYNHARLNEVTNTLHSWSIWRRGRRFSHIWRAIQKKSLSSLKEKVFLLKNR